MAKQPAARVANKDIAKRQAQSISLDSLKELLDAR
jgi:hypothetical protein